MVRAAFVLAALLASFVALGCGGGPPRKPTPPDRSHTKAAVRDMFQIRGIVDEWHEAPVIKRGLKQLGGVESVEVDETTGKYVVVYNQQRTSRDAIRRKIIEIGEEQGRHFDPIFDDR